MRNVQYHQPSGQPRPHAPNRSEPTCTWEVSSPPQVCPDMPMRPLWRVVCVVAGRWRRERELFAIHRRDPRAQGQAAHFTYPSPRAQGWAPSRTHENPRPSGQGPTTSAWSNGRAVRHTTSALRALNQTPPGVAAPPAPIPASSPPSNCPTAAVDAT